MGTEQAGFLPSLVGIGVIGLYLYRRQQTFEAMEEAGDGVDDNKEERIEESDAWGTRDDEEDDSSSAW